MNANKVREIAHAWGWDTPQHYELPDDFRGHGKIIIRYKPFWRRLPIIGKRFPYYVGDKVRFNIGVVQLNPENHTPHLYVYEVFNDKLSDTFNVNANGEIDGNYLTGTGDVKYFVGETETRSIPILTAQIRNTDEFTFNMILIIFSVIIGGALSLVITIATGLVKINPIWEVWFK